jgi:hypothetical protein
VPFASVGQSSPTAKTRFPPRIPHRTNQYQPALIHMAKKKPDKPSKNKAATPHTTKPTNVGGRQQLVAAHVQALASHAHALTAHALALSAHAQALGAAAAPSQKVVDCVFGCLQSIAPGATITNNSILSKIPIPDLPALGVCINHCVPLTDPSCWGGGVDIDGNWRVSDLIAQTECLRNG